LKGPPAKVAPPLSDWDNARRELHGEKTEPAKTSHELPSFADVLLKVLAENGKHFQYLGENENLTVVVTFRGPAPVQSFGGGGGRMKSGSMGPSMPGSGAGPGMMSSLGGSTSKPFGAGLGSSTSTGSSGLSGSSSGTGGLGTSGLSGGGSVADPVANAGRDYELLGDLHTRQGKIVEALDAYSKAVQAAKTMTIRVMP